MISYEIINILDLLKAIGENCLAERLSCFLCPKNPEIEHYVRNNAIDFAKRKISITYFVISETGDIAGVFALTHKAAQFVNIGLSNTKRKKLEKYATYDRETNHYIISAYLIAQFGKNYAVESEKSISGNELMKMTLSVLRIAQKYMGGEVVFLECEDKPKLINFYQAHNFVEFNKRYSEKDRVLYIQMFSFL